MSVPKTTCHSLKVIEAYELLGCGMVDERDEYDLGVDQWRKALMLRFKVFPKTNLRQERIAAFQGRLEFSTRTELDGIVADPDEIRMQSLLIRERVCGQFNRVSVENCLCVSSQGSFRSGKNWKSHGKLQNVFQSLESQGI